MCRKLFRQFVWLYITILTHVFSVGDNGLKGKSVSGSLHHNKHNCLHDEEFHCMDSEVCVLETSLCDGVSDCPKGDDESSLICGCLPNEFSCNGTCIVDIRRCDTRVDCPDGSDEESCETHICPSTHFKCDNHMCVPNDAVCDFANDCGDLSDERNCSYRTCWYGEYRCNNSQCVRGFSVCDDHRDCLDGSDEDLCHPTGRKSQ
ncbi:uncharacterized protein LOC143245825 [Tachypleus tridentatus]|uniref:uncharacterized protein LOC143245825 n=1 Tax=Tachypleus tridentatus TaxID=6853 RepID=UPI003FD4B2A7